MSSPCGGESDSVLYGWGKDAPAMHLPDGVGFSVGPRTAIRTVVLQASGLVAWRFTPACLAHMPPDVAHVSLFASRCTI